MLREKCYLRSLADFGKIPVSLGGSVLPDDKGGVPVLLRDIAHISIGGEARRGVTDLDGEGEATGGIVVMRYGSNALDTVQGVKQRLAEIKSGLPEGVEVVVTYDRSGLIRNAVDTLQSKLVEESVVVALVCLIFLLHLRSSMLYTSDAADDLLCVDLGGRRIIK